jgi:LmbE family N-acetylglucosaminyl deacetylase
MPPVLFVSAHPDDETLSMGVAIAEHVAAGRDVHVLWMTGGGQTGARKLVNGTGTSPWWGTQHDPAAEGYPALTFEECAAARLREARNAVRCLASPGTVTVHEAGYASESVQTFDQEQAVTAIEAVVDQIGPAHIKGHTWLVDNHADHLAVGGAIKALAQADPSRYLLPRYYVQATYWSDPRLAQVADSWDNPTNAGITARVRNAIRAYGSWSPPYTYAIGRHSVPGLFDTIDAAPKCLYHP